MGDRFFMANEVNWGRLVPARWSRLGKSRSGGAGAGARPSTAPPIFFDESGKRWQRILISAALALLVAVGGTAWVLPQALDQTWHQPLNQGPDYARQLLASGDVDRVPVVGEDTGYAFARVGVVKRLDGTTVLGDPFSDEIFRTLTKGEEEIVGSSPYAMERFGKPADGELVLTFDDGPSAEYTEKILDVLADEGIPATFFNIGSKIPGNSDTFQRMIREGHAAGNHTMSHLTDWNKSDARHREELIGTDRAMRSAADYATRLFRIPEGDPVKKPLAVLQAQQLGYLHVDWDVDTRDWDYGPDEQIELPELDGKGHIVLMHDGGGDRTATVDALKLLISEAKAKGYRFSTVTSLLPENYAPQVATEAEFANTATSIAVTTGSIFPGLAKSKIFWFWTISMTVMSCLYIVLALVGHRRQKRRTWRSIAAEDLPLVSVVLPVYNEEVVVTRTLDALKASDYPRLEVIAVNDGSTDGTLQILQDYAETWPTMRVLSQPNGGKSMASNHGIMAANGTIVVTLDGDTLFEPQTIGLLARHFYDDDGGRPVGAVAGHVKVGNRRNLWTAWQSAEYITGICVHRMAEGVVGAISVAPGACAAWSKEALQRAGGYSHDTLAEDNDLTLSIQRLGYAVVQENQAIAWTEAPMTLKGLAKQRVRWTYGNLQAMWKNADMLFRPEYGALGMVALPYSVLSTVMTLVFLPFILTLMLVGLATGAWQHIVVYIAFVSTLHTITCFVAIRMIKENPLHLLIVPIFRFVYEPLRIYVLYASLIQALKGRVVGWYKPERTNSVMDLKATLKANTHRQTVAQGLVDTSSGA